VPYADPVKRADCARKACKRYYRGYQNKELGRAAAYRRANRLSVAAGQREYPKRKLAADPTYRLKIVLQIGWKKRCRRAGVHHAEPFLRLLGTSWQHFTRYFERRFRPGMSWENFGAWSIDHLFPVCAFNIRRGALRSGRSRGNSSFRSRSRRPSPIQSSPALGGTGVRLNIHAIDSMRTVSADRSQFHVRHRSDSNDFHSNGVQSSRRLAAAWLRAPGPIDILRKLPPGEILPVLNESVERYEFSVNQVLRPDLV
jgi:hypothetical protein